jgi:6-phosphogluconate dehydrogenase
MDIAMIGLGRMGANMTTRLLRGGHRVVVFDMKPEAVAGAAEGGAEAASSLADACSRLTAPRTVWVMVPAGDPTERTVSALGDLLERGDVVIDGGNSNYRESMRRAAALHARGIHFIDAGTSGGVWGLKEGYSLMIGGEGEAVARCRPVFETLAPGRDRRAEKKGLIAPMIRNNSPDTSRIAHQETRGPLG